MKRTIRGAVMAAPFLLTPSVLRAQSDGITSPRNASVNAAGAHLLRVEAGAGILRILGRPGLTQVEVKGTARANSESVLRDIHLIAERRGDEVFIKSEMPNENFSWFNNGNSGALDLIIEVPQGMSARVDDGSGDAEIRGVGDLDASDGSGEFTVDGASSVHITDGSGGLSISNVQGDVSVRDGSGDVVARNVNGSFTIESDGSGGIFATDIRGSVIIERDGSGEVNATRIGRDFVIRSKGSGSVTYSAVTGRVDIPERKRRDRNSD
jgi:DUF4097 and DUF4098 domain-containing protein YvlB